MSYDGIEHHLLESCQLAFSKQRYSRVPSYDIIIKTNDDIILGNLHLKKQQGIFPLLVHFLPFHDKYSSSKNVNEFRRNFTVLHYLTLECDLI